MCICNESKQKQNMPPRPSLVVQCLGFGAPNAGGWDQSLVRELDPVCLQLKSLHAQGKLGITRTTTKTQNSQKKYNARPFIFLLQ